MGDIISDTEEIKRTLRTYFKAFLTHQNESIKEMDEFLNIDKLPKLNQDQISKLTKPINPSEVEALIKNFPHPQISGLDGFSTEFLQTFKGGLMLTFPKLLCKKLF